MWQGVPWFVAGGVHPPEVARLLAYAATGGGEGIIGATDAKVTQANVPDDVVVIAPGAVVIPNSKAGAAYQSYMARSGEAETVPMTPTGSSGPRTDLIIARIEDPHYPGAAIPTNPTVGPYVFTRVIEGVPAGTTRVQQVAGHANDSATTLARVTRPANTGTVLNSHITDLRKLSKPNTDQQTRTYALFGTQVDTANITTVGGELFPNEGTWPIEIPKWATAARIIGMWCQCYNNGAGSTTGHLFVRIGATLDTQAVGYDTAAGVGGNRTTMVCADDVVIPAALRGTTQNFHMRARKLSGATADNLKMDNNTSTILLVDFLERPA